MTFRRVFRQRKLGSLTWLQKEPELIKYAIDVAGLWLERELKRKGEITGDHLDKACGILTEEIFAAELNELRIPHIRTVPLLDATHPVNANRPFDFKINTHTIDIKAISPNPPKSGHHKNLNVNKSEVDHYGFCDLYVCAKLYPQLERSISPQEKSMIKDWASEILGKVEQVDFIGYAYKEEVEQAKIIPTTRPFYSLNYEKLHPMKEFAELFKMTLG